MKIFTIIKINYITFSSYITYKKIIFKDAVKSVLLIGSAHNKGEPSN